MNAPNGDAGYPGFSDGQLNYQGAEHRSDDNGGTGFNSTGSEIGYLFLRSWMARVVFPSVTLLFGFGLIGLMGAARRRLVQWRSGCAGYIAKHGQPCFINLNRRKQIRLL